MTTRTQQIRSTGFKPFPLAEIEARLRRESEKVTAEGDVLRGSWEPPLDSLRMVSVLLKLVDLFDFDLRPEKVVRKGGYTSVEGDRRHAEWSLSFVAGASRNKGDIMKKPNRGPLPAPEGMDRKGLSERLREAREYLGFSQEEVANFLGIARSALSNIENGQRKVDALELKRLAQLYERTASYFTGETEEAEPRFAADVAHLARKAEELSPQDREELSRFADFLRARKQDQRGG
jgi:transcriptional regulator with XRE-family HTH domain